MKVVPDVLPDIHPSLDLRVNFPKIMSNKGSDVTVPKAIYEHVEPGVFLLPEQVRSVVICAFIYLMIPQTVEPPKLFTTVFHPEERLYTLLMIDPGQYVWSSK
jgi:large subunit ribosomal protein L35